VPPRAEAIAAATERLIGDGLLRREGEAVRTTRRWQGAMSRAALRLLRQGQDGDDLRVPVAGALVEIYGGEVADAELARLVQVMSAIEARELSGPGSEPSAPA
jgi:hypothetical protein